jgi:AAA15 family ATPase/GTPase
MIREIQIKNFKSIESLTLELGRFNVLIGANGCGKSNILEAITFGAAAPDVKLTNEFLATRGIRMTEPVLMQSAFAEHDSNKGIQFCFLNDKKETIAFDIQWKGDEWRFNLMVDDEKSNIFNNHKIVKAISVSDKGELIYEYETYLSGQKLPPVIIEKLYSFLQDTKTETTKYISQNELHNFVIFAPENFFLPLGIRGEGLFRHLATIGFKNPAIFDEVKESLSLIEWFDDLEFDITADGYFTGRIKIKDTYLQGVKYFDQRSANEGFLYLLFYLTLFISDETPKFFAIDNIDNALNPKLATDLMKTLAKLAEKHNKQVLFTTHNPAILDGLNLNDPEQRLFVISRNAVGHTKASRIEKKPTQNGHSTKLSEQFLRGYIGGLNF